jgi:hypothetical protein
MFIAGATGIGLAATIASDPQPNGKIVAGAARLRE